VKRRYWTAAGGLTCFASLIFLPYLPRGTDLYVHVLWPWQVMRCLHAWSLPLWMPDLNAGFGSPGIGLYSPLAPTVCGVLGLVFGTGGRGVRAALALTVLAAALVAPGRDRRDRVVTAAAVLLSPAILVEFFGRFPVAQMMSLPLAWVLLERAVDRQWRWHREGILLALLWLVHAPTTLMVGAIAAVAVLLDGGDDDPADHRGLHGVWRRFGEAGLRVALTGLAAAGLTAWHWWPLLSASGAFPLRAALTGGEQAPLRNLIGVPGPHLWEINTAMGWAATGLLTALLLSGGWRSGRGRLAVLAVFLATLPSAVLWRLPSPLIWLQFPWRWMLPATLLAVPVIIGEGRRSGRLRFVLALVALFAPLAGMQEPRLAVDPALAVDTEPADAGKRIAVSFSGNPLMVDVKEHRPLWWESLGPTMALLGQHHCVLLPGGGSVEVVQWHPLRRMIMAEAPHPSTVVIRLLADEHWRAEVNGQPEDTQRWGAALAVRVPGGRSRIEIGWRVDPLAIAGAMLAAAIIAAAVIFRRRRINGQ
jgi:hypothetical protein